MKENNVLEKIGEKFGSAIVELVRVNRAFTVTILEVDDTYASVTMTGSDKKMTVPLTCTSINFGYLKVKPKVDSIAIVTLANGVDNAPFFMAFSEVDEIMLTVGESSVKVNTDVWEFNGGTLGGIVKLNEITEKLNALENGYNSLVAKYNAHVHAANGTPTVSLETTVLTPTQTTDIENEKITQ